jgi:hypothetical protein
MHISINQQQLTQVANQVANQARQAYTTTVNALETAWNYWTHH